MMVPLNVAAYHFESNGIYYSINYNSSGDHTVSVTYKDSNFNSYSGSVTIPSTVTNNGVEYTVTAIGSSAFRTCPDLTSVTIPNTVKTIGYASFSGCI